MSKDPIILLKFVLESIENLEQYIDSVSEEFYLSNIEKQDATERRLQVIGQAIIQLPEELKEQYPEIEWHKIAGLRNRIVHDYLEIDHLIIWNTLKNDLPIFKKEIQELIR